MFTHSISVDDFEEHIYKLFANEQRDLNGKAQIEVKRQSHKTVFTIYAPTPVGLKIGTSSVTKLLTVYEKMKGIEHGSNTKSSN